MTLKDLADSRLFEVVNIGDDTDRQITKTFCCDLLSIAMSRAPAGCAWVTVMGNINTLAVASLSEAACIILAEGVYLDDAAKSKAIQQGITVFCTNMPVFETALTVHRLLHA